MFKRKKVFNLLYHMYCTISNAALKFLLNENTKVAIQIRHDYVNPATHSTRNDKLNESRLCPPIFLKTL